MPWHIRVSRAVACDNLQPRVNAHHWHIRAFFIGELPPNFLLQKTGPHTAYRHMRTCLSSAYHTLIDHFPVKRLFLDQLRDQVKRQTDHT